MRLLTIDIETSPNSAHVWHLFGDYVSLDKLQEPTKMLCYAAKYFGEKEVYVGDFRDPRFLPDLWHLLDNADAVITYNGSSFDMKHINREFVEADLLPVRPLPNIDLFKTVKQQFKFPSNKLDYVAGAVLGVNKLDTGGFGLWPAYMQGDESARRKMERYNIRDVRLTERLYKKLRPWIKNHPNMIEFDVAFGEENYQCPACTSKNTFADTPRRTRCYAIRQVRCGSCGHWFDGKRIRL